MMTLRLVMAGSWSLHRARGHILWVGQAAQNWPRPSLAKQRCGKMECLPGLSMLGSMLGDSVVEEFQDSPKENATIQPLNDC